MKNLTCMDLIWILLFLGATGPVGAIILALYVNYRANRRDQILDKRKARVASYKKNPKLTLTT